MAHHVGADNVQIDGRRHGLEGDVRRTTVDGIISELTSRIACIVGVPVEER